MKRVEALAEGSKCGSEAWALAATIGPVNVESDRRHDQYQRQRQRLDVLVRLEPAKPAPNGARHGIAARIHHDGLPRLGKVGRQP